jgi:hypothetical protein
MSNSRALKQRSGNIGVAAERELSLEMIVSEYQEHGAGGAHHQGSPVGALPVRGAELF